MFEVQRPIPAAKPRLKNEVKPLGALLAAVALLLGLAGPAAAESQTVVGSSDIKKMFVSNGQDAVVAKIYGPGAKCSKVKELAIHLTDKDGTEFTARGACHPGDVWGKSLDLPTAGVSCPGFRLAYNATGKFWRFDVPRTCLKGLANGIKVDGWLVTWTNPSPGLAGPTRRLARG
jgi:hypothetical protein